MKYSLRMDTKLDTLATERAFFSALISANLDSLDSLLADDFILIDLERFGNYQTDAAGGVRIEPGEIRFHRTGGKSRSFVRNDHGRDYRPDRTARPGRRIGVYGQQPLHACVRDAGRRLGPGVGAGDADSLNGSATGDRTVACDQELGGTPFALGSRPPIPGGFEKFSCSFVDSA